MKRYNRRLMMAISNNKVQIVKAVNVEVITLDDAAKKFVIDPHGLVKKQAA